MAPPDRLIVEGNEAAARVAHRVSEVIALYPITPASGMGELSEAWSAAGRTNLWGQVPEVIQMQGEGGAAGTLHGVVLGGSLGTSFTASQGLLLMLPNLFRIAGELTPAVIHVAARSVATHAMSIYGDHSDVMAVRGCGWGMLFGTSVQEAQDLAAIAHAATLRARIPFLHIFDGFRTSHELATIHGLSDTSLRTLISEDAIAAHRARGLTPERPTLRGTAQQADLYFQAREAANPWYDRCEGVVEEVCDRFADLTGRRYGTVDYHGHAKADRVVVILGSGAVAVRAAVDRLMAAGERVGVLTVRLYRPFPAATLLALLPATATRLAVLDRTKEPGALGEPLFTEVAAALAEAGRSLRLVGGRYGLSSKEFTPSMAAAAFAELDLKEPRRRITVGITDDVTHLSLEVEPREDEPTDTRSCVVWALGNDGTVATHRMAARIITEDPGRHAQVYVVHDAKKSGSVTVSHLRFSERPIEAPWLIRQAGFVAVHAPGLLWQQDVLAVAAPGATVLLNLPHPPERVWRSLPREVRSRLRRQGLKLYTIDAVQVATAAGLGGRISTVMQAAFFALANLLPRDQAMTAIESSLAATYANRGPLVVERHRTALRQALASLHQIEIPRGDQDDPGRLRPPVEPEAPAFVRQVLGEVLAGRGDLLPVSRLPADGTFPTGTSRHEKRRLADQVPVWEPDLCHQCGKCSIVCPHGCLRATVFTPDDDQDDDALMDVQILPSAATRAPELPGRRYVIQVSPEDCTGCGHCVSVCPGRDRRRVGSKALTLTPFEAVGARERMRWQAFLNLPVPDHARLPAINVRNSQLRQPYFEFSGACSGCGQTPYLKLLSQLIGDRLVVANATGCSSAYGGSLPTTPWTIDAAGRGPAWASSLFEDNAEFGLGLRLAADAQGAEARALVTGQLDRLGSLATDLLTCDQADDTGIAAQRRRVAELRERLAGDDAPEARRLLAVADSLIRRSVWLVGGDGWANDIGFGGLDHVLASGRRTKVLVLDTEVYANTGGQASKSTSRGAVAKSAATGKASAKKDLGWMVMSYGSVYVAQIALGADDAQAVQALTEAEAFDGPALVIAYSHCLAHGIDMRTGPARQKAAVACGHWPLYRFHPDRETPLSIDSPDPLGSFGDYLGAEGRYRLLAQADPAKAERLAELAHTDARHRLARLHRAAGH